MVSTPANVNFSRSGVSATCRHRRQLSCACNECVQHQPSHHPALGQDCSPVHHHHHPSEASAEARSCSSGFTTRGAGKPCHADFAVNTDQPRSQDQHTLDQQPTSSFLGQGPCSSGLTNAELHGKTPRHADLILASVAQRASTHVTHPARHARGHVCRAYSCATRNPTQLATTRYPMCTCWRFGQADAGMVGVLRSTALHSRGHITFWFLHTASRQASASHNPFPTHIVAQWLDIRGQQHAFVGLGRDASFRCHASGCLLGTCLVRGESGGRLAIRMQSADRRCCTKTNPHDTTYK
jgi:hypothetical protein